jgi:hypothetical protein
MSDHIGDMLKKYQVPRDPTHEAVKQYLTELCGDGLTGFAIKDDVVEVYVANAALAGELRYKSPSIQQVLMGMGLRVGRISITIRKGGLL